jgi:hypothetical protein
MINETINPKKEVLKAPRFGPPQNSMSPSHTYFASTKKRTVCYVWALDMSRSETSKLPSTQYPKKFS